MKLSVSLPSTDLDLIDQYAHTHDIPSRSAVVHEALQQLRAASLENAYAEAWREWETSEDAELWENTIGDGITRETR